MIEMGLTVLGWLWRAPKIVRHVFEALMNWCFVPEYKRSHERWLGTRALGKRWQPLGPDLEYSLRIPVAPDHESEQTQLAVRATSEDVSEVLFVIEAAGAFGRFQQHVKLTDVKKGSVLRKTLQDIPRETVHAPRTAGDWPVFAIHSLVIRDLNLRFPDGRSYTKQFVKKASAFRSWFLNSTYVRVGSKLYNIDSIVEAKRQISLYWRSLIAPRTYVPYPVSRTPWELFVRGFAAAIVWIFTRPRMVDVQFWLATWARAAHFDGNRWHRGPQQRQKPHPRVA